MSQQDPSSVSSASSKDEILVSMLRERFCLMKEPELLSFISLMQAAESVAGLVGLSGACWVEQECQLRLLLIRSRKRRMGVKGAEPPSEADPKGRRLPRPGVAPLV